jgi:hypothetical protein
VCLALRITAQGINVKFFNLNIKHNEYRFSKTQSAAQYWLDHEKKAVVFYGPESVEELNTPGVNPKLAKAARAQLFDFLSIVQCNNANANKTVFITVDSGFVWIYSPEEGPFTGDRFSLPEKHGGGFDTAKYYRYDLIKKTKVSQVPLILASMKSNQHFSRRTFAEIGDIKSGNRQRYAGNIAALLSVMGYWPDGFKIDPVDALSSIELETLVSKIFEEKGCHVPAARGGSLPDIDLFVFPPQLGLPSLREPGSERAYSVQIKLSVGDSSEWRKLKNWCDLDNGNILITLQRDAEIPKSISFPPGALLTREWVVAALRECRSTNNWFEKVIGWLPEANRGYKCND